MKVEVKAYQADLVIVGAGIPGICAAVQAARQGLTVALINDRGVLGGNGSCEIHVNINGSSDGAPLNINSREGGVVSEILTEYKYRSPVSNSRYVLDGVLLDIVGREPNIKLFLNTYVDDAEIDDNSTITSVSGSQNTTETRWRFTGSWFVDNTGDGTLGALAGAEYMLGREAKETFDEKIAPDKADKYVLPSTLMFHAKDMGYEVPYKAPDFAFDIPSSGALERRIIPQEKFHSACWYYEIGGEYDHVKDREEIIADHKSLVYGIWDYVKNSGNYPQSANYDFEYVSTVPGTREYRRLVGDYILTEKDIVDQTDHEDTVGHGGWNIDLHAIKGFFDDDIINRHIHFAGIYKIPYRTAYSKNITNMFMCGRCMSTSHVAFGSIRVISTLATVGQAVGMAAYLCKKYNASPRGIYENHIRELQQRLLVEDQLIVGVANRDDSDLALSATVAATSCAALELAEQVNVNGKAHVDSLAPEYRTRLRKSHEEFTDHIDLTKALGISLPVRRNLENLFIKVRAGKATELRYNVYLPEKPENYGPDRKVSEGEIQLPKSRDFSWIKLPVSVICSERYALVELLENEHIQVAVGGTPLPTTIMFRSRINTNPSIWDVKTMGMSHRIWDRAPYSLCYRVEPQQPVYRAENVNNGYNRAYGLPNMWLSDKKDETPTLTLSWGTPQKVARLQLTFAADMTKRLYWESFWDVDPLVAQNYRISAKVDGTQLLLKEVKDNFRRVNRLSFDEVVTDEIILEFDVQPRGQVGLYEARAYARD
jgi:hypothetical protein